MLFFLGILIPMFVGGALMSKNQEAEADKVNLQKEHLNQIEKRMRGIK